MSDPVTNLQIEDVLSSIRKLVADDASARKAPAPEPASRPGKLVLTAEHRVDAPEPEPEKVAPNGSDKEPGAGDPVPGSLDDIPRDARLADYGPVAGAAEDEPAGARDERTEEAGFVEVDPDDQEQQNRNNVARLNLSRMIEEEVSAALTGSGVAEDAAEKAPAFEDEEAEEESLAAFLDNISEEEFQTSEDEERDLETAQADDNPALSESAPEETLGSDWSETSRSEEENPADHTEPDAGMFVSHRTRPGGDSGVGPASEPQTESAPESATLESKIAELERLVARGQETFEDSDEDVEEGYATAATDEASWPEQQNAEEDDMTPYADAGSAANVLHARAWAKGDLRAEPPVYSAARPPADPLASIDLDEDMLRDMVSDIVRQELQGALGERITRNVRKLVRREIHRLLISQDLE